MDLISLIIIISVIVRIFKKNSPEKYEDVKRKAKDLGSEVVGELRGNVESRRATYEQQRKSFQQQTQPKRQAQPQRTNTYEMPKQSVRTTPAREQVNIQQRQPAQAAKSVREENDVARMQVQKSRMEAQNTTILYRAKANAEEDKEDVTLRSLEESHGHSARVAPAVHNHPEDEIPENMLGKIEDLMAKGYEGNLCFERDFVGEAMDMVARFSLGGSVANES